MKYINVFSNSEGWPWLFPLLGRGFWWDVILLVDFSFIACAFGVIHKNSLPHQYFSYVFFLEFYGLMS